MSVIVNGEEIPPRDKRRKATPEDHRLYRCNPRGIGLNWGKCFVCGSETPKAVPDCACFVPSRETGEAIVGLFEWGAVLDYRPREPQWIQVKITACEDHRPALSALVDQIGQTHDRLDGPGISREMIEKIKGETK